MNCQPAGVAPLTYPEDSGLWGPRMGPADRTAREQLILRYMPLVHSVVGRLGFAGAPEYDDMVSQGVLGLIQAVDRYQPQRGVPFAAFASRHIQGRVRDGLRGADDISRTTRQRARRLETAAGELERRLGRAPDDAELAAHVGLRPAAVRRVRAETNRITFSLDTASGPDGDLHDTLAGDAADPLESLLEGDLSLRLRQALGGLPQREQKILAMRYAEGLTLKQIAGRLHLTEARVSQLHSRAVLQLRFLLQQDARAAQAN